MVNLYGIGLAALRFFPRFTLALPAAVLGITALLFFVEHFFGLGLIRWLWPFTTAAAAYSIYLHRASLRQQRSDLAAFAAGFAYGFIWRMAYPDIGPSSEHMTDLFFISNYLPGATLPPDDLWFPSQKFDYYYAFQHYAAALLGRLFGLDGGTAYNFAFCIVFGLLFSLAWFTARNIIGDNKRYAALIVLALAVGGTGISPLYHLLFKNDVFSAFDTTNALWANTRFIGMYDKHADTALAENLLGKGHAALPTPELPLESLAYLTYLGDFHPPLGGFVLLLLALACIAWLEQAPTDKNTQALLAFTVPLAIVTNAWVFPLQALLVSAWLAMRILQSRLPDWKMLAVGAAIGMALVLPFMSHFAAQTQSVTLKWIEPQDRVPAMKVLLIIWPLLALAALGIWQARSHKLALLFCLMLVGVLTFTSLLYFQDSNGGLHKRFNTTLKWWSWIQVLSVVALAAVNLAARSKIVRYGTVAVLLLMITYGFELARYWVLTPRTSAGKMAGHHWFTQDTNQRDLLAYLRAAPAGIVLENIRGGAYNKSGAISLFAAKPSLLTWPDHLGGWKGNMAHMRLLQNQITQFYAGQQPDMADWLQANNVRYILWTTEDNQQAFDQVKQQIEILYQWKPFVANDNPHLGVWVLK
ncbi:MAG: DUF2298 domain-containing protein [Burkholderiales bacterium]